MRSKIVFIIIFFTLLGCKNRNIFLAPPTVYKYDQNQIDLSDNTLASNSTEASVKYNIQVVSDIRVSGYKLSEKTIINPIEKNIVRDTSRKIANEDKYFGSVKVTKNEDPKIPKQTIISFIFGVAALLTLPLLGINIPLSIPFGVLSLVFGLIGLKYIIKNKNKGLELSIVGMSLGVLSLILSAILILLVWTSVYKL